MRDIAVFKDIDRENPWTWVYQKGELVEVFSNTDRYPADTKMWPYDKMREYSGFIKDITKEYLIDKELKDLLK